MGTTISLLFHEFGFPLFKYLQLFFWFRIVLAEYFYSLLCFIWFLGTRWSSLHGMGVATLRWACTHLCHSLNKSLGWIILLMLRIVAWSFGCRLKFIYSVVLVDEQVYLLSFYSLCYIYILCASDLQRRLCQNLLEFLIFSAI